MDLQDQELATPESGAAYWDARLRSPGCSAQERAAFARWRDADPANRAAYEKLQGILHDARAVSDRPELRAIRADALARTRTGPRQWSWTTRIAAAAAAVSVLWLGSVLLASNRDSEETGVNQHRPLQLADGSKVTLGARSRIAVHFDNERRRLTLESGQAYFTVAKDDRRPFVVEAGPGTIKATGTAFDVRIATDVWVTVVEGSVEVASLRTDESGDGSEEPRAPAFETTAVRAGQRMTYGIERAELAPADVDAAVSWLDGHLTYRRQPLRDVLKDVARYSRKRIVLADDQAGNLTFTGRIACDNVHRWVERLGRLLPVEVEAPDRRTLVVRSRPQED